MREMVPFFSLSSEHDKIKREVMAVVERVYDGGQFILGDELTEFEKRYAAFTGTGFCIGVGNGYDALVLSLRALGVGVGDEVLVPSHTYIATWLAVSAVGARIVPVEPDPETYNLNGNIKEKITARTRAIIPVHLYGQSCRMNTITDLAAAHGLYIVEDNAQSHGAEFRGRLTGSFGHCNATSFYPVKNLGALGDAGAVTTSDPVLHKKILTLRNHGAVLRPVHDEIGVNSRMDELQAAILNVKLKYLGDRIKARRKIASVYVEQLSGVGDLVLPSTADECSHVYHLFVVRTSRRDALIDHLRAKDVGTMIHYPIPPHLQPAFSWLGLLKGSLPVAEELSRTCLSLPLWPGMSDGQVAQVVESVKSFWR